MQIDPKLNCPLNKFKPCKQMDCAWFTKIAGFNPNTGREIEEWGCAITWLPVLLIENSQKQRETGAAVESFRNLVAENTEKTFHNFFLSNSNNDVKTIENNNDVKMISNDED